MSGQEIKDAFSKSSIDYNKISPDIQEKCSSLCDRYAQTPSDLVCHLEAFMMNEMKSSDALGDEHFGRFEQYLLRNATKSVLTDSSLGKRPPKSISSPPGSGKKASRDGNSQGDESNILESSFSSQPSSSVVKYSDRATAGQVVTAANTKLAMRGEFEPSKNKPLGMRCRVTTSPTDFKNIEERYRFMFTTLDERALALDRHLLHLQSQMCALAHIPESALQPVGIPSQDMVWVCGRICCEAAEGRINKSSVVLEGSRRDSFGRRVRLDLQDLQSYSLFPGQIVLIEGLCGNGRVMVVKRIMEGCALPMLTSPPQQLLEFHHGEQHQEGAPLSVVVAAGPFTTTDNLEYKPLEDLMIKVLKEKPDVLVLVGPFVDISQPLLASGNIKLDDPEGGQETHDATFEMVFIEKFVRDSLQTLFDSEEDFGGPLPTQIVLVPSLLDAHHEFVFPQPPFGDRDEVKTMFFTESLGKLKIPHSVPSDPKRRVHLMPNPCMFRVNEVLFGVCSNDVMFQLSSDEVSANIEGNRVARLATHLLQQQSFCPQFPVPPNAVAQLDLRHAKHWEFSGAQPDVLVLPSRLAPMCKDARGSLMINTGQLAKGAAGGTYAQLAVHPVPESELRDAIIQGKQQYPHNVCERTGVKIVRI